ncbi:hypothetical protein DMC47_37710 [Nostoc sp. 3335mG]|nr:hypothetical protein DMC47_37710 [Nostoc sp. 3335mG]
MAAMLPPRHPERLIRANLIAPLVAGPAFCLSIGLALTLTTLPSALLTHQAGQSIGTYAGGSLLIGLIFALPVAYIPAVGFAVPLGGLLDSWAERDGRWAEPMRWAVAGMLGGLAFGLFLCLLTRPGHNPAERVLMSAALLIGGAGAGSATAWIRNRITYGRS